MPKSKSKSKTPQKHIDPHSSIEYSPTGETPQSGKKLNKKKYSIPMNNLN